MTTSPSRAPAEVPPRPQPAADGLVSAARRNLREVAHGLCHPSHPPVPPLANASKRWRRLLPYVVVIALTALFLPVTLNVLTNEYGVNDALAGLLAVAQAAPLLMLAHRPLQAWWIVFPADVVGALVLLGYPDPPQGIWPWPPPTLISYIFVMLAVALRETRRTAISVWALTAAASLVLHLAATDRSNGTSALLPAAGALLMVIGAVIRERGDAQRRLAEQETISEAERAQRTLLEERARIARELHDVVAHHMSVITVQADSAPYRINGLPEEAREEFEAIAASARESLAEMRRLLTVLRNDGTEGERAPQPGLDRLQQLVEATVRAGLPAELSVPARLPDVPQAVDVSAYRIVQEALANVVRHAPGALTRVSVASDGAHLTVLVVNDRAVRPVSPLETTGTGHGLVGMRERVRLTGGTLDTGPLPDGGFRVAARLPLTPATSKAPEDS
ncbi:MULTISPECIES: sensor histidine kinase [unclassified Streptomyces]|uniref:sensor histidine kinase n=1 Tax=unclassified Streptomyces TaxID=2593676 RepID=UPI0011E74E7E|nr:sensor histidine kinase [Streptomyces sp. sk2.1]TXS78442.1 sensor histidine kinase [Streptomyces sp. sk2.1]